MNEIEEAIRRQLVLLSSRDGEGLYNFVHPEVVKDLEPYFDMFRSQRGVAVSNLEVFDTLYDEYSYGDYEDIDERPFDLLGVAHEAEDFVHAVIRRNDVTGAIEDAWVETISLKRHHGEWRPLLTPYFIANLVTELELGDM